MIPDLNCLIEMVQMTDHNICFQLSSNTSSYCVCVCNPILVTTFPEWLSCAEPLPHTPGAVRPSSSCLQCVCMHMYSFASLIRQKPPPTFSDTAITNRHSDTTIFQLRAHWMQIFWSIGSEKVFGHVPPVIIFDQWTCPVLSFG